MYCGCQRTVAPEGTLPVVDPGGGAEDHLGQVEGLLFRNTAETVEISVADRQKPPIWTHTKRTFWKDLPWTTDPSCRMSHSCHGCLSRHGKKAKPNKVMWFPFHTKKEYRQCINVLESIDFSRWYVLRISRLQHEQQSYTKDSSCNSWS